MILKSFYGHKILSLSLSLSWSQLYNKKELLIHLNGKMKLIINIEDKLRKIKGFAKLIFWKNAVFFFFHYFHPRYVILHTEYLLF